MQEIEKSKAWNSPRLGCSIKPDFMITHKFSLDQAAKAFELLADYRDGVIKAVVNMG